MSAEVTPERQAPARPRTALYSAIAVGVVLALLIGVLATRRPSSFRLADSPLLGRLAPPLAGPSLLGGGDFDLADQDGRFVLVNFFADWCTPCIAEHDDLLRFAATHEPLGDARVVSVVFSSDPADVEAFFEERGGDWPVIDDSDRIPEWGVTGVPESYLVGPEGRVRAKVVGGIDVDRLEDLLRQEKAR